VAAHPREGLTSDWGFHIAFSQEVMELTSTWAAHPPPPERAAHPWEGLTSDCVLTGSNGAHLDMGCRRHLIGVSQNLQFLLSLDLQMCRPSGLIGQISEAAVRTS
jgi:hypothetical protein